MRLNRASVDSYWRQIHTLMDWRDHIYSDPGIGGGQPIVRGTRLKVTFLLSLFAQGWTWEQVLQSYPRLTPQSLAAIFAYAAEVLEGESVYPLPGQAA